MSTYRRIHVIGKDQHARTPACLVEFAKRILGSDRLHDPCPENPTEDGLLAPWKQFNFVNPPFVAAKAWLTKGLSEFREHGRVSAFLLPARTHTRYFNELVFTQFCKLIFFQFPIRFVGYKSAFPLPLCLIVVGQRNIRVPRSMSVPYAHSYCGSGNVHSDVFPMLRDRYGPFDVEMLDSKDPRGLSARLGARNLICAMADPAEHLRQVSQRPARTLTVIMVQSRFEGGYFRDIVVQHADHILFLGPSLTFDSTWKSYVGSVAVVFGASRRRPTRRCYFVKSI